MKDATNIRNKHATKNIVRLSEWLNWIAGIV